MIAGLNEQNLGLPLRSLQLCGYLTSAQQLLFPSTLNEEKNKYVEQDPLKKKNYSVNSTPKVGLTLTTRDQELHALHTELARCPRIILFFDNFPFSVVKMVLLITALWLPEGSGGGGVK